MEGIQKPLHPHYGHALDKHETDCKRLGNCNFDFIFRNRFRITRPKCHENLCNTIIFHEFL
jgi:hypothetical protein